MASSEDLVSRREQLVEARKGIARVPCRELFELSGRPLVAYEIRDYHHPDGRRLARFDLPFLFKAFETGQTAPPRAGTKNAAKPRAATIHEYLDWTVTAEEPKRPIDLDFGGFRVVAIIPRHKPNWPAPGVYEEEAPKRFKDLGAESNPLPVLLPGGKAISAATVRLGLGWMEIPFVATQEQRRNRGFGRALLDSIEEIARFLQIPRLLLCSTDDNDTKETWRRLGFVITTAEDLTAFGILHTDLIHMDNTVQMHKTVAPPRIWKTVIFRHEHWRQRLHFPAQPSISSLPMPTIPDAVVPKKAAKKVARRGSTPKVLGKRQSSAAQMLDL